MLDVQKGVAYTYWLEVQQKDGTTRLLGPTAAQVKPPHLPAEHHALSARRKLTKRSGRQSRPIFLETQQNFYVELMQTNFMSIIIINRKIL